MRIARTTQSVRTVRRRGWSLIECLVYIGCLAVVLGVGMKASYRCWDDSKAIRRDAEDIARAVRAGERWRADIRSATGGIRTSSHDSSTEMEIPTTAGRIIYSFSDGELRRRAGASQFVAVSLPKLKSSLMQADTRTDVSAWTWELELKPVSKKAKLRPLFTFSAVGGARAVQ